MTNKINNVFLWILLFPIVLLCIKAYNNIESYNCHRYYDTHYDYDYCNIPYNCTVPCNDLCEEQCDENLESGKLNVGGCLTMDGNYLDQLPDQSQVLSLYQTNCFL